MLQSESETDVWMLPTVFGRWVTAGTQQLDSLWKSLNRFVPAANLQQKVLNRGSSKILSFVYSTRGNGSTMCAATTS